MAEAKIRVELVDLFSSKIPQLRTFNKEINKLIKTCDQLKKVTNDFNLFKQSIRSLDTVQTDSLRNMSAGFRSFERSMSQSITSVRQQFKEYSKTVSNIKQPNFSTQTENIISSRVRGSSKGVRDDRSFFREAAGVYMYGNAVRSTTQNIVNLEEASLGLKRALYFDNDLGTLPEYLRLVDNLSFKYGIARSKAMDLVAATRKFAPDISKTKALSDLTFFASDVLEINDPIRAGSVVAGIAAKTGKRLEQAQNDTLVTITTLAMLAQKIGNISPADMVQAFGKRYVATPGITAPEQAFLLASMMRGGASREVSGTALQRMVQEVSQKRQDLLIQSNGNIFEALNLLSIEFEKSGNDPAVLRKIFGQSARQLPAFKGAMQAFVDFRGGVEEAVSMAEIKNKANLALQDSNSIAMAQIKQEYQAMLDLRVATVGSTLEAMKAGLESLGTNTFETLMPGLKGSRDGFVSFIKVINDFINNNQILIQQVALLVASIAGAGGLLWAFSLLATNPAVLALAGIFMAIANAIMAINKAKQSFSKELELVQQDPATKNLTGKQQEIIAQERVEIRRKKEELQERTWRDKIPGIKYIRDEIRNMQLRDTETLETDLNQKIKDFDIENKFTAEFENKIKPALLQPKLQDFQEVFAPKSKPLMTPFDSSRQDKMDINIKVFKDGGVSIEQPTIQSTRALQTNISTGYFDQAIRPYTVNE